MEDEENIVDYYVFTSNTQFLDADDYETTIQKCLEMEELYTNYSNDILFFNDSNVKPKQGIPKIEY